MLSGGEKGRLELCKILSKGPNLLLLDEPTNHMDIIGKESLENILKEYKGTLIFVSHDRYFVNKLADAILEFKKERVTFYNTNYKEYLKIKEKQNSDFISEEKSYNDINKNNSKIKNEYFINKERDKKKKRITKIESEIDLKEKEIEVLKKEMEKEGISTDYIKLNELEDKIKNITKEIEEKMEEWEKLNNEIEEY